MRKKKELLRAAAPRTARVRLLREIVEEAERSVQFIDDPCLKLFAFEKNLDTLLNERYPRRAVRPPPPSDSKG